MKLLTVIGARPQFVKAAVVSRAVTHNDNLSEVIVHTGQHFDENMSEVFFQEMDIPKPHYNLQIANLSHGAMTGRMMESLEEVLLKEKPDALLVYGDTNSTIAGALAAVKLHIPVAHVEAGLRSFNMKMPEEVNRILTDRISTWLFCPTEEAIINLKSDGLPSDQIFNVGDVMLDAAIFYSEKKQSSASTQQLVEASGDYILCTCHRAENTDDPEKLESIFAALREIVSHKNVILPLHPRTKKRLDDHNINTGSVNLIDPVGYLDMIHLLQNSTMVMTDSGGLQKEAFFFQKPCVTLREETEWVETVQVGANKLVGSDKALILKEVDQIMKGTSSEVFAEKLYGDGQAGQKIVDILGRS